MEYIRSLIKDFKKEFWHTFDCHPYSEIDRTISNLNFFKKHPIVGDLKIKQNDYYACIYEDEVGNEIVFSHSSKHFYAFSPKDSYLNTTSSVDKLVDYYYNNGDDFHGK